MAGNYFTTGGVSYAWSGQPGGQIIVYTDPSYGPGFLGLPSGSLQWLGLLDVSGNPGGQVPTFGVVPGVVAGALNASAQGVVVSLPGGYLPGCTPQNIVVIDPKYFLCWPVAAGFPPAAGSITTMAIFPLSGPH